MLWLLGITIAQHAFVQQQTPPFELFLFLVKSMGTCSCGCACCKVLPVLNCWPPGVVFAPPGTLLRFLSLISFVIVTNASSTLVVAFAEVSKNGMLNWAANSSPSSFVT